jgi:hypothetical protein
VQAVAYVSLRRGTAVELLPIHAFVDDHVFARQGPGELLGLHDHVEVVAAFKWRVDLRLAARDAHNMLRAAILAAIRKAGPDRLRDDEFGRRVQAALGFTAANRDRRPEWMIDPEIKGVAQVNAEQDLSRVLAYRVWADQRRGWRFTNPNLEELGLVDAEYISLDELATDDSAFTSAPPELRLATPVTRKAALAQLLTHHGLAVTADALDPATVESTSNAVRQSLRDPWADALLPVGGILLDPFWRDAQRQPTAHDGEDRCFRGPFGNEDAPRFSAWPRAQ